MATFNLSCLFLHFTDFFPGCSVGLPLTHASVMTVSVVTLTMSLMHFSSLNLDEAKLD